MESANYKMRAPCKSCGAEDGRIEPKSGQNCVYCIGCGKHVYNAPKVETGEEQRSVRSRPEIKPSTKAKIMARDLFRCVMCGRGSPNAVLHIGHILSVKEGEALGATEDELYHEDNLVTLCEEDNLGMGSRSFSPRSALFLLRAQLRWKSTRQ